MTTIDQKSDVVLRADEVRWDLELAGNYNGQWRNIRITPAPSIFHREQRFTGIRDVSLLLAELVYLEAPESNRWRDLYTSALGWVKEAAEAENWLRDADAELPPDDDDEFGQWFHGIEAARRDIAQDDAEVWLDHEQSVRLLAEFAAALDDIVSPGIIEAVEHDSTVGEIDARRLRFLSVHVYFLASNFSQSYFHGPHERY